jgi:hypothetical protein
MLAMTACSQLVSLNPLVPEGWIARNPLLAGVWSDDEDVFVIKEKGDGYTITMTPMKEKAVALTFSAQLFRVGSAEILDLVQQGEDDLRLAVHTPVRIWVEQKKLRFIFLDSEWFRDEAAKELAVQEQGKRAVVTSQPQEIAKFLLTHAGDDRAYQGTPGELARQ